MSTHSGSAALQWGPVEYHKQSLRNLEQAVRRTRRLCAVLVDTLGRELMIRRTYTLSEDGWPVHEQVEGGPAVSAASVQGLAALHAAGQAATLTPASSTEGMGPARSALPGPGGPPALAAAAAV